MSAAALHDTGGLLAPFSIKEAESESRVKLSVGKPRSVEEILDANSTTSKARALPFAERAMASGQLGCRLNLVEPDGVMAHHVVDAEAFVRVAAFDMIVPKFMDPLPSDRQ